MIPQQAIEKAREGGYKVPMLFSERKYWHGVALDPTFWQALGKALGWTKKKAFRRTRAEWMANAYQFYGLILTGNDMEKFWQEILK